MSDQKKIAEEFDNYSSTYKNTVNSSLSFTGMDVDFFTRVKADYIIDLINSVFGKNQSVNVLDIGCGVGNFHRLLTPRIDHLTGIDISAASISQAEKLNPDVNYDVYDGLTLPYANNSFDVTIAICVMHHVPPESWNTFTQEVHRVLKPGGLALVFEHNPSNMLTRHVVNNCPFDEDAVLLKGKDTVGLFKACDFETINLRYILTIPAKGSILRAVDRCFSRIALGAQYYVSAIKAV